MNNAQLSMKNLAPPYQLQTIRDTMENLSENLLVGEEKFFEVHKANTQNKNYAINFLKHM